MASPPPPAFDEVVLHLTRQSYFEDKYVFQLTVRKAPHPLAGGAFRVESADVLIQFRHQFADYLRLAQLFYTSEATEFASTIQSQQLLAALGEKLYELLPTPFCEDFPLLIQRVFERGRSLRLVIEVEAGDQADQLLSLPWEILFFDSMRRFPARSQRLLIVRRLREAGRRSPLKITAPFNVLHAIAHHRESPRKYQIDEDLQQVERTIIPQAVTPGRYDLIDAPGSIEGLRAALGNGDYQVFHFLGHGELFETVSAHTTLTLRQAHLRFVSATGESQWVTGGRLEQLLHRAPSAQLVVLNACHGGALFAGNLTLELVYQGVPYVVAMQGDVLQEAAGYFIRAFYQELQQGHAIEYAVAAGRHAIADHMPSSLDWCLPVFYTSVGLAEPSARRRVAERIWQWFSTVGMHLIIRGTLILGGILLFVALLLWLSGVPAALPNAGRLALEGGWFLLFAPPIIAFIHYRASDLIIPDGWQSDQRVALFMQLLGAAAIGLGIVMLVGWCLLLMLAAMGFWYMLTSLAQWLILAPLLALALLVGDAQAFGFGRAFMTNAQVQLPTQRWADGVIVFTGYLFLLLPVMFEEWIFPWLNVTPNGVVLGTGILLVVLGLILQRDQSHM